MKIIIGLGNPGKKYEKTRHNIGFRVIDKLSVFNKEEFRLKEKFQALVKEGFINEEKTMLVKPQTFMNNSGESVRRLIDYLGQSPDNLLIVSDDFNLALGKLRLRRDGSSGGHKGLQSIIDHLGHDKFSRLRIGIGLPEGIDAVKFVLEKFSSAEGKKTEKIINDAVEAIIIFIKSGIETAMNKYN